ncbi:hypothetical protein [Streptomyces deserti]
MGAADLAAALRGVNFAGDQHAADAFVWRVHPLAPLPDRPAGGR